MPDPNPRSENKIGLLFGIAVTQFQEDGQTLHFRVLVSRGQDVFGSKPSEVAMFGTWL
jgi:hypothetical protein